MLLSFLDKVPSCPATHNVNQAGLKIIEILWVVGSKVSIITSKRKTFFDFLKKKSVFKIPCQQYGSSDCVFFLQRPEEDLWTKLHVTSVWRRTLPSPGSMTIYKSILTTILLLRATRQNCHRVGFSAVQSHSSREHGCAVNRELQKERLAFFSLNNPCFPVSNYTYF